MIDWTFYIDNVLYDEPIGFSDVLIRAKRDNLLHGIFFEASTSDLTFYGDAAAYLVEKKDLQGFSADVTFRAVATCGEETDVLTGRLDFRKFRKSCGNECLVTIPVEMEGCTMTLMNRYDQKVDISKNQGFDGLTVLPSYAGLNFEMELAAQDIEVALRGFVQDGGVTDNVPTLDIEASSVLIRPIYGNEKLNSIATGQLIPNNFFGWLSVSGDFDELISPQLLFEDNIKCYSGEFPYEIRFKGHIQFPNNVLDTANIYLKVITWDGQGNNIILDGTELHTFTINEGPAGNPASFDFDQTFIGNVDLPEGVAIYAFIWVQQGFDAGEDIVVQWDQETFINISANKSCPPTTAVVSLIHETASRIVEAITDRCLTVKSDYYGRTDSEPYAATEDGCGSLRIVTSGLRLRKAENPTHFMSLKDLFDGLNAIDNIGMGIEVDKLRIEPVEYFYKDIEIMRLPFIPKANYATDDTRAYSIIKVGYKKWETEGINGLDEFNSNKEFRTSLKNISNTLDITSAFIAGGYPIELTRQQSFAESGGADTKYDNDNFIICVEREAYGYRVEQGNIDNAANIYSPATAYNWRIRPFYNLMRWWKSIAQSYANLVNTASKFIFSAGTGNLEAEGELPVGDPCKLESVVKAENEDLLRADFAVTPSPLWKPDTIQFVYPFSLRDYNLVKDQPYGYISVQCGTGDYVKAFITNLLYKPAKGEADITLRLQWPTV